LYLIHVNLGYVFTVLYGFRIELIQELVVRSYE